MKSTVTPGTSLLAGLIGIPLIIAFVSFVFMVAWNAVLPYLFNWKTIDIFQSFFILVMFWFFNTTKIGLSRSDK